MKHRPAAVLFCLAVFTAGMTGCHTQRAQTGTTQFQTSAPGSAAGAAASTASLATTAASLAPASETTLAPALTETTRKAARPSASESGKSTTTKKQTGTTKTTTSAPAAGKTPHEIVAAGLKSKMPGARVLRAWRVTEGEITVLVEKLSYGNPVNTTYQGKNFSIPQVCFIASVTCRPENLRNTCAELSLGKDEALVNDMAKKENALIAINNEGYNGHWDNTTTAAFLGSAPVIKNGTIIKTRSQGECHAVFKNGEWKRNYRLSNSKAVLEEEIRKGLSYTQAVGGVEAMIWDGKMQAENPSVFDNQTRLLSDLKNRTFYAQIDENHYLLMVGEFMQMGRMMDILLAYGAKKAFWCNGGNCTYMYLRGVGNVTGAQGPSLRGLDKLNVLEQEWLYNHRYLPGAQMGGPCPAIDMVYIK